MHIKLFETIQTAQKTVPEGTIKKLFIKENEYVIIHTKNEFTVAEALCPHMKESLHKGSLNAFNQIICPLHEYRFDLETGTESSRRCPDLKIFKVEVKADGLYLNI